MEIPVPPPPVLLPPLLEVPTPELSLTVSRLLSVTVLPVAALPVELASLSEDEAELNGGSERLEGEGEGGRWC